MAVSEDALAATDFCCDGRGPAGASAY